MNKIQDMGDTDNGLVFCGSSADRIKEMTTVRKIFDELFPGTDNCTAHKEDLK